MKLLRTKSFIYSWLLFISIFNLYSQNNKIDELLKKSHSENSFNGNVLVMQNDIVIYENFYGFVDATKNSTLNTKHQFMIGSIYKEFPAVAIMQLQEKNLLSINDSISKFIPNLPIWGKSITIKNLLQYASGLPKINWRNYFSKGILPTNELLFKEIVNTSSLAFTPGTDYLYTNASPILLIRIIENISKLDFETYLTQNIFTPNGLKNIKLQNEFPFSDKKNMAIPFNHDLKEDPYKLKAKHVLFTSDTKDLYHWFSLLANHKIISKKSLQFLSKTVKEGEHIQSPLGNCTWENDTLIQQSHHGSSGNYECLVQRFNEDNICIVILTNQKNRNVFELSTKILNMIR